MPFNLSFCIGSVCVRVNLLTWCKPQIVQSLFINSFRFDWSSTGRLIHFSEVSYELLNGSVDCCDVFDTTSRWLSYWPVECVFGCGSSSWGCGSQRYLNKRNWFNQLIDWPNQTLKEWRIFSALDLCATGFLFLFWLTGWWWLMTTPGAMIINPAAQTRNVFRDDNHKFNYHSVLLSRHVFVSAYQQLHLFGSRNWHNYHAARFIPFLFLRFVVPSL